MAALAGSEHPKPMVKHTTELTSGAGDVARAAHLDATRDNGQSNASPLVEAVQDELVELVLRHLGSSAS